MTVVTSSDHYLSNIDDDLTTITDIDFLKFQLIRQRRKLFSIIELLIKTELSYENNLFLRIDYDKLLDNYNQLNQEYNQLKDKYQHLGHACLYLINKTQDLIDERNKYYNEWKINKSLLTPRPDWDKVSNVIDGGNKRWKILSAGKSSEQLMEILIREIVNENQIESIEENDYFEANGDQESVLSFLRTSEHTQIVNRRMRRRMTGLLIKEIWTDKIRKPYNRSIRSLTPTKQYNSSGSSSPLLLPLPNTLQSPLDSTLTLADHVATYFEKRFDSKAIAIEMGYNLRDACQRYHNSEEINLFWGIITGQIEEMVYHYRMQSISQLLQHLIKMKTFFSFQHDSTLPKARKAIVSEPNSPVSMIANRRLSLFSMKEYRESPVLHHDLTMTNEQFIESLKVFYPNKTDSQIDELFLSAKYDLQHINQSIEFSLLFIEDNEGRFGKFLSTLIQQLNQEKFSYVEEIKQILLGHPLITVSQFCRAVLMIDPKINQNELHRYIEWVFSIKNFHSSQQIKPLDFEDLLRRLENCACFKH
ncbi:unnamed protein product [Adineta steineri]|uniref:Uncharacterized protein n=2 Tax=Adineta steineri TaxID=433720 RepID=A0A818TDF9_9BILA|nr:unnamed protein product [Adineta steineri]CAF3681800.1 unnamed protein product [Adineta steineri]